MSINPEVNKQLNGIADSELQWLVMSTYRYDSISGKGITDAIRYEKATGDTIGKNFQIEDGNFLEPQAVSILCQLLPEFDKECLFHLNQLPKADRTVREVFHRLAIYLAENIANFGDEDTDALFELIELILNQGQASLKNLVGNYFLEDFQNIYGNLGRNPEDYVHRLKPDTKKWWDEINRFWADLEKYEERPN